MYVVAWVAIGAAFAGVALALLADGEEDVTLPVVEQTELERAAERADCRLRRGGQPADARPRVEGAPAKPVAAGRYGDEQPESRLVGALRQGTIVIQYRPGLDDDDVERLAEVQQAFPRGTILAPNADMPYEVAVTGWRRLLGCQGLGDATLDAVRLFHGRYVGQGPDVPG